MTKLLATRLDVGKPSGTEYKQIIQETKTLLIENLGDVISPTSYWFIDYSGVVVYKGN